MWWRWIGLVIVFLDFINASMLPPPAINTAFGDPAPSSPDVFKCEICLVVMERKESMVAQKESNMRGECAGMEVYHTVCDEVLHSSLEWHNWIDQWQRTSGCVKITPIGFAVALPCPAHVICSWITDTGTRQPYCPPDHTYHSSPHSLAPVQQSKPMSEDNPDGAKQKVQEPL
eukprot:c4803_g1_i1.p1 GENE.c4803_g1_i1~~c4803_g1_i1.p1  ORF type:complete len:173 (+),score=51.28 c4803_g1_i1:58-576(+)